MSKPDDNNMCAKAEVLITKEDIAGWKVRQILAKSQKEFDAALDVMTKKNAECSVLSKEIVKRMHTQQEAIDCRVEERNALLVELNKDIIAPGEAVYTVLVQRHDCRADMGSVSVTLRLRSTSYGDVCYLGTITEPLSTEIVELQAKLVVAREEYDTARDECNILNNKLSGENKRRLKEQFLDEIMDNAIRQINGNLLPLLPADKKACAEQPAEL